MTNEFVLDWYAEGTVTVEAKNWDDAVAKARDAFRHTRLDAPDFEDTEINHSYVKGHQA